jgi:predicted RNase H-like nuclease (RuvC/YqgF family)
MRYSKPQLEEMLLTVSETIDHYSTNSSNLLKINEGLEKQNDLLRGENEMLKSSVSAMQSKVNDITQKAKELLHKLETKTKRKKHERAYPYFRNNKINGHFQKRT